MFIFPYAKTRKPAHTTPWLAALMALSLALPLCPAAFAAPAKMAAPQLLPTGQALTPTRAPGAVFTPLRVGIGPHPDYVADGAARLVVSPNGHQMLALTSGYNRYVGADGKRVEAQSGQYIMVYGLGAKAATLTQTLMIPNAFAGIAWRPDGLGFAVSGGVDDTVQLFHRTKAGYAPDGAPITLSHAAGNGGDVKPQAAGLAFSPDGRRLLVANYYNDSVSLIDIATRTVVAEQDLRPGKIDPAQSGIPGGEYPFDVVWRDASHAYISAARDREILALDLTPPLDLTATTIRVASRLKLTGEPTALLYDAAVRRLYATEDNADRLALIDSQTDTVVAEPRLGFPDALDSGQLGYGVNPNGLARLPDGTLLVTLGGINAVALVAPKAKDAEVIGLVPTGWYPSAVATTANGRRVFVVNRKSPPGANPQGCQPQLAVQRAQPNACGAANQYIFQLEKAGLLQFPLPTARPLARLTLQVADNTGLSHTAARKAAEATMATLRARIKHVVFIVKENRTYDQVLGDLEVGNGDPHLAILGEHLTPTHHQLARQFVDLDNFLNSGEQSSTGWSWSTAARATDVLEKTAAVNYAGRGLAYESEGSARNVNVAADPALRRIANPKVSGDPDLLPGPAHPTSPDGDDADDHDLPGQGFLWNAAIRAGLSVRNYGFANDYVYDDETAEVPLLREAAKAKQRVYIASDRDLMTRSDPYYRSFDQRFPDVWNVKEWMREFDAQDASGTVPALTLLRISHDHFGDFKTAIDGVNTVERQMADNDYAFGMIVEHIAHSQAKDSTLIFVIEDDAQNGADHVDARRSIAFVVGPYVRQHAVVSTRYTTVSLLRTIESVLGLKPLGLNDALATPMADAFDLTQGQWDFKARASRVLKETQLPIPPEAYSDSPALAAGCMGHDAAWWAEAMKGQDFSLEDRLDTQAFNTALWQGLGTGAEPVTRTGADLRHNRPALLQALSQEKVCR